MFDNKFTKKDSVADEINKIISEEPEQIDESVALTALGALGAQVAGGIVGKKLADMKSKKDAQKRKAAAAKIKAGTDAAYDAYKKKHQKEGTEHTFADYLIDNYKNCCNKYFIKH